MLLVSACGGRKDRRAGERVLFTLVGNTPFQDYVYTLGIGSRKPTVLLRPTRFVSYLYANGNSLHSCLVVTTHDLVSPGRTEDHLWMNYPTAPKRRPILTGPGRIGRAALSPDNSRLAFEFARDRGSPQAIWVTDPSGTGRHALTSPEGGAWDGYPAWGPDGKAVAFIRFKKLTEGLGTQLMVAPIAGGKPSKVLGVMDGVAGASYSREGTKICAITRAGVEILSLGIRGQASRAVVLPWFRLPHRAYRFGGISWSGSLRPIALAAFNVSTNCSEIWKVSEDGSAPDLIYSTSEGTLEGVSFIRE